MDINKRVGNPTLSLCQTNSIIRLKVQLVFLEGQLVGQHR